MTAPLTRWKITTDDGRPFWLNSEDKARRTLAAWGEGTYHGPFKLDRMAILAGVGRRDFRIQDAVIEEDAS